MCVFFAKEQLYLGPFGTYPIETGVRGPVSPMVALSGASKGKAYTRNVPEIGGESHEAERSPAAGKSAKLWPIQG